MRVDASNWRVKPQGRPDRPPGNQPLLPWAVSFVHLAHGSGESSGVGCSLGVNVELLLLEVWGDALHDLLGLGSVINLEGEEVLGGTKLELGDRVLLVLLDSDLFGLGEVLPLSAHNLDELLQILNLLGLRNRLENAAAYHCVEP